MKERLKMLFKMGLFNKDIIVITRKGMFAEGKVLTMFANLYGILCVEVGEDTLQKAIINHKNEVMKNYENTRKVADSKEKE